MIRFFLTSVLAALCMACFPGPEFPASAGPYNGTGAADEAPVPVLVIRAGTEDPFWFELGPGGPVLIPSPAEASLVPFIPWSHARHITGFLPEGPETSAAGASGSGDKAFGFYGGEAALFAGVNRGGILGFEPRPGELALYYHHGGYPENYSLAALFRHEGRPAILLAADRFFSPAELPAPDPPVLTAAGESLRGMALPALEGREIPALQWGGDGFWYFRQFLRDREAAWFRTADLSRPAEQVTAASFEKAAGPAPVETAPALLALALDEAARLAGRPCVMTAVSPAWPGKRLFSSSPVRSSGGEEPDPAEALEAAGYWRDGLALVLLPGGRGVYGKNSGSAVRDGHFRLPPLPEGFAYTGAALAGNVLAAAWEEQAGWNLGAAGFLALEIEW